MAFYLRVSSFKVIALSSSGRLQEQLEIPVTVHLQAHHISHTHMYFAIVVEVSDLCKAYRK